MLGYLDALIAALSVRDAAEADRLLRHPLARLLPDEVRAEATAFAALERDALAAPLRTMQLRHQTAELLRDGPPVADWQEQRNAPSAVATPRRGAESTAPARSRRQQQMELPLSA